MPAFAVRTKLIGRAAAECELLTPEDQLAINRLRYRYDDPEAIDQRLVRDVRRDRAAADDVDLSRSAAELNQPSALGRYQPVRTAPLSSSCTAVGTDAALPLSLKHCPAAYTAMSVSILNAHVGYSLDSSHSRKLL